MSANTFSASPSATSTTFGVIPARFTPYLLSLLRIAAGLSFMEHGTGKLLGFPVLHGLDKMPVGMLYFTGLVELIGGALIVVGLFSRIVGFVLAGFMAFAFWMVHVPMGGIFPAVNGGEAALLYCFVFLFIATAGPGPISVDRT